MARFFITTSYGDISVPHYFFALAGELVRRGHEVTMLVAGRRYDIEDPTGNPSILTWPSVRPTGWRDARFLYRLIRQRRPDCVVGNFAAVNLCLLVGWLGGVRRRVAWYHTMRQAIDADHAVSNWKRHFQKMRKGLVYRLATHIVANSQAAARDIQRVFGVPSEKCSALPILIPDPPQQNVVRLANKVVCVGRLNPSKGQATLIRALPLIRATCADVIVRFVGDGPERQGYEDLAASLGVADCCQFVGALPLQEALREMASAAVCVSTSQSEAFGLASVEAQGAGTPVVASAVDGIKEVVLDGETGYLAPGGDHAAFADKVSRLLVNQDLRRKFGLRAREHFVANFSNKNIARHADWLEGIAENGRAGAGD
jgi:glycosyltransferase involved in cell wall biosynthesis